MRAFNKRKKQIQEDKVREITRIVKESFAKLSAEEYKRQISIPVPQRFYCMEHKIYETPQDYNEEMNRRMQASDFRHDVAYKKGREETAREVVKKIIDAGKLDFCDALCLSPNEKPSRQRIGRFYADVEKLNEALSEFGIEIKETVSTIKE